MSYSPPEDDIEPASGPDPSLQGLLTKAINTIENVTNVSYQSVIPDFQSLTIVLLCADIRIRYDI